MFTLGGISLPHYSRHFVFSSCVQARAIVMLIISIATADSLYAISLFLMELNGELLLITVHQGF